jgi:hypothetical protein
MATIYKKFHTEEIEQVIAEYLAAKDIAGRTPGDVAHEIVEIARVAVPKARRRSEPLDRSKLSTAVAAALEKLGRNEPLWQPVTPRWVKKYIVEFDEFAASDGRLAKAQNLCFKHQIPEAACVLEEFFREKGVSEPFELKDKMFTLLMFLRERRAHEPQSRCLMCTRSGRLARCVFRAFQGGGELAASRLMMEIEHRRGRHVASEVWANIVEMQGDQEHSYFQYSGNEDGRAWRPRLRLVG